MNAFPVLSETFVTREVVGLRRRGLDIEVFSLFPAGIAGREEEGEELQDSTHYFAEYARPLRILISHLLYIVLHPVRYFSALRFSLSYREARGVPFQALLKKDRSKLPRNVRQDLLLHFILAVPLARMIAKYRPGLLNAHFADAAASITLLVSKLLGVPYGITMHAYDIFSHQYNMAEKLDGAGFVFTCTKYNKSYLIETYPKVTADKVRVFYHGIPTENFAAGIELKSEKPIILSVGRLVPKKGFTDLLDACAILARRGISFECRIIGEGPLKDELQNRIEQLGLADLVKLLGAVPHPKVLSAYREATVFVLPSRVDEDGDRDGIPNVIAEAMAMGLPVVATDVSAIPELVQDNVTGLLVAQKAPQQLAEALEKVLSRPGLADSFGQAARHRAEAVFDAQSWLDRLAQEYRSILQKYE